MEKRDLVYTIVILAITISSIIILTSIPNYLRTTNPGDVGLQPKFIIIFFIINLILIGVPAGFHKLYTPDYSKLKNIWFFAIFGGIVGGLIGERSFIMIIPYTILMLIYTIFYKRFTWWKVALTTPLAGILIENAMNHSPIQIPTSLWISFFIYPYFVTKIWENKNKLSLIQILKDFKYSFLATIILLGLIKFIVKSLPWAFILLAIVIPIIITIIYRIKKKI